MSQYYIVSEEMKKAKRNFSIPEQLEALADDLKELEDKYKENHLAVQTLKYFGELLENAEVQKSAGPLRHLNHVLASMLENLKIKKTPPDVRTPNAVAGTRG